MKTINSQKHLTLEERIIIETGIRNGSTKQAIATTLGKDKSTIGKEIKLHREITYRCNFPRECSNYSRCKHGRLCPNNCPGFKLFDCKRRDRTPGACNGCSKYNNCRFTKYFYKPNIAHNDYKMTLVDTRTGVNLTTFEAKELADTIKPLLDQGQSPYHIILNHPELGICEKTLYNYIDGNVLSINGITNFDLRRKVNRRIPKNRAIKYKKRTDWSFLKGRKFEDYKKYILENPNVSVVQMDTVYNDISNGPFIQTFKFIDYGFMFGIYQKEKTATAMVDGLNKLEALLGNDLFIFLVNVLLTDRGLEFSNADGLETSLSGNKRTNVFYCDPMQSCQKGSLENNHEELRYICPKETDLYNLGLRSQSDLNLVLSHINSCGKEKLNGKSPLELMSFLNPDAYLKFCNFGIKNITRDNIILKPYLLKK